MLTPNVKNDASIEVITQKKPRKVVLHDIVMFPAIFLSLCDLYHVTLTLDQLKIMIYSNSASLNTII